MNKPIVKVGDLVKITKSNMNWTSGMDIYDGKVVKVIEVHDRNDRISIKFDVKNPYAWIYENGHFVIFNSGYSFYRII